MIEPVAAALLGLVLTVSPPAVRHFEKLWARVSVATPIEETRTQCLKLAETAYQEAIATARDQYAETVQSAKDDRKDTVKSAWEEREETIRAGRVKITAPDENGRPRENKLAERTIFERAKAEAENYYETSKVSAKLDWRVAHEAAKFRKTDAYGRAKDDYGAAKADCAAPRSQ